MALNEEYRKLIEQNLNKGNSDVAEGNWESVRQCCRHIFELMNKIKMNPVAQKIEPYLSVDGLYIHYCLQAATALSQIPQPTEQDERELAYFYSCAGNLLCKHNRFEEAIGYLLQTVAALSKILKSTEIASAKDAANRALAEIDNTIGQIYFKQNNFVEAEKYYLRAGQVLEKISTLIDTDNRKLSCFYDYAGMACYKQNNFVGTEKYYLQAAAMLAKTLNSTEKSPAMDAANRTLVSYYSRATMACIQQNKFREVEKLVACIGDTSSNIQQSADKDFRGLVLFYQAVGKSYFKQNKFAEAEKSYLQVGAILVKIRQLTDMDRRLGINNYKELGSLCQQSYRFEEANAHYRRCIDSIVSIQQKFADDYIYLSIVYEALTSLTIFNTMSSQLFGLASAALNPNSVVPLAEFWKIHRSILTENEGLKKDLLQFMKILKTAADNGIVKNIFIVELKNNIELFNQNLEALEQDFFSLQRLGEHGSSTMMAMVHKMLGQERKIANLVKQVDSLLDRKTLQKAESGLAESGATVNKSKVPATYTGNPQTKSTFWSPDSPKVVTADVPATNKQPVVQTQTITPQGPQ